MCARLAVLLLSLVFAFPAHAQTIALGRSAVALNGPWKFHTGDNPRWSQTAFDDSRWTDVDLTPKAGAHDSDVGLTGYVPGWSTRGYPGYHGYAWYRMRVTVAGARELALTGPPMVDSAYQVYANGQLLGGDGDFSRSPPVVHSIQPRLFHLPAGQKFIIAIRVWMPPRGLVFGADYGGIHIAPMLGSVAGVEDEFRRQWLQTFEGYLVDAAEGLLFLLLAAMTFALRPFSPQDRAYVWLAAALCTAAILRGNQEVYFWGQSESDAQFILLHVLFEPLALAAWLVAWRSWFGLPMRMLSQAITLLTLAYVLAFATHLPVFHAMVSPAALSASHWVASAIRLAFLVLYGWSLWQGISRDRFAVIAMVLIMVGLFSQELSALGVPGIWFPWGVGVSLSEYANAVFDIVLSVVLLRRLYQFLPGKLPAVTMP